MMKSHPSGLKIVLASQATMASARFRLPRSYVSNAVRVTATVNCDEAVGGGQGDIVLL